MVHRVYGERGEQPPKSQRDSDELALKGYFLGLCSDLPQPIDARMLKEWATLAALSVLLFALDGNDLRHLTLSMRKTNLARLLARRHFVTPFEQGEIGPELFRTASNTGLEGLVSKRRDRSYQAGRS